MMDYAKAHYFHGIKGNNTDADNITQNLHAFQECIWITKERLYGYTVQMIKQAKAS